MIKAVLKLLMVAAAVSAVTGCNLAVMVTSGGDVTSLSGTRNCAGGAVCEFQITDANFSESFTAVAKPGYEFVKWQKSTGFLCGDSASPTCTVALSGNAVLDAAIIALFNMNYIMPTFKDVGIDTDSDGTPDRVDTDDDNDGFLDVDDSCPLKGPNLDGYGCPGTPVPEAYYVGARTWANLSSFAGYSYTEIDQVCPLGVCSGLLGPYGMNGWHWATRSDIVELASQGGCYPQFFQSFPVNASVLRWTNVTAGLSSTGMLAIGPHINLVDPSCDVYSSFDIGQGVTYPGAWFYRDTVAPN